MSPSLLRYIIVRGFLDLPSSLFLEFPIDKLDSSVCSSHDPIYTNGHSNQRATFKATTSKLQAFDPKYEISQTLLSPEPFQRSKLSAEVSPAQIVSDWAVLGVTCSSLPFSLHPKASRPMPAEEKKGVKEKASSQLSSRGNTSHRSKASSADKPKKKKASPAKKKSARFNKSDKKGTVSDGVELEDVEEGDEEGEELEVIGVDGLSLDEAQRTPSPSSDPNLTEEQKASAAAADKVEAEARVARDMGRLDEAERLYRNILVLRRAALGDRHPLTVSTIDALGAVLYMEADLIGAEALLLEALQARRETLGERHPDTVASISNSGMLLKDKGDLVGAEALLSEAVRVMQETSSSDHTDGLICKSNLGALYKEKGDLDGADRLLRDTLGKMRSTLGARHPATLAALVQLGLVQLERHDLAQAEALLAEALTANRETFGDGHPQTLASITWLAGLHEAKGELKAALPLHMEVLSGFASANHPMTQRCAGHVVALLRQEGRAEEADNVAAKHGIVRAPAEAPATPAPPVAVPPETSAALLAPIMSATAAAPPAVDVDVELVEAS